MKKTLEMLKGVWLRQSEPEEDFSIGPPQVIQVPLEEAPPGWRKVEPWEGWYTQVKLRKIKPPVRITRRFYPLGRKRSILP